VRAGVDDVFVFINTFRQSASMASLQERMWHTLSAAAKATFCTSLTTAAAFAANIFSSVSHCSLAVLDPRVGHTMDVLSPFISVVCHSD